MAAALTVTPAEVQVGDQVVIDGTGFLPSTKVVVTIPEVGVEFDVNSDAAGEINSTDLADKASATLSIDNTFNAIADETVTIGTVTYTWKASPTTVANEVKIGADANASLDNLKAAVNHDTGSGSLYGSGTVANPDVVAMTRGTRTLLLAAKVGGTAGNSLTSTETMTKGNFAGATFAGGAAATGVNPLLYTPTSDVPFTVKATDGTNTATASVKVFTE